VDISKVVIKTAEGIVVTVDKVTYKPFLFENQVL
jgi:hypothetical protein